MKIKNILVKLLRFVLVWAVTFAWVIFLFTITLPTEEDGIAQTSGLFEVACLILLPVEFGRHVMKYKIFTKKNAKRVATYIVTLICVYGIIYIPFIIRKDVQSVRSNLFCTVIMVIPLLVSFYDEIKERLYRTGNEEDTLMSGNETFSKDKEMIDIDVVKNDGDDGTNYGKSGLIKRVKDERKLEKSLQDLNEREKEFAEMKRENEETIQNRENTIKQAEMELSNREKKLEESLGNLEMREKELEIEKDNLKKQSYDLEREHERKTEALTEYEQAIYKTEERILDWVEKRERNDIEVFNEIMKDADKFKGHYIHVTNGYEFEEYVSNLLRESGYYNVNTTPKSKDFGADITAEKDSVKYVFQCKYYDSPVGVAAVQEICTAKYHYNAHVGVVVTNSVFTKAAKVLAEEANIILWDCEKLSEIQNKLVNN
jgi:hypothetical protein